MEEKLVTQHVKSVLAQMCKGYSQSLGSYKDYLANSSLGMVLCPYKFHYQKQMIQMLDYHRNDCDLPTESGSDTYETEESKLDRRIADEVSKQLQQ